MNAIFAIARRETSAYFASPIGWICLVLFSLLAGLFFSIMLIGYASQAAEMGNMGQDENVTEMLIQGLFGNLSVIALLMMPALTMGLVAADRRERSIELLLTSPVTSAQIVLGKFLGGLGFATVMVLTTLYVPISLVIMGEPDPGVFYASYGGFIVLMAVFVSIGLFTSSVTEKPARGARARLQHQPQRVDHGLARPAREGRRAEGRRRAHLHAQPLRAALEGRRPHQRCRVLRHGHRLLPLRNHPAR